jgi:hypothetical protein
LEKEKRKKNIIYYIYDKKQKKDEEKKKKKIRQNKKMRQKKSTFHGMEGTQKWGWVRYTNEQEKKAWELYDVNPKSLSNGCRGRSWNIAFVAASSICLSSTTISNSAITPLSPLLRHLRNQQQETNSHILQQPLS